MKGKRLYSPSLLNKRFANSFRKNGGWSESRYRYFVTTNRKYMEQMIGMSLREQREFPIEKGIEKPIQSYKQTDFFKDRVAVEVQFGKYAFVAYNFFV